MRRNIAVALLLAATLSIGMWLVDRFVAPILPSEINSGFLIYFTILGTVVGVLAGLNEITELVEKWAGNGTVSPDSLLLYPYDNPPYNSVEAHYVGDERAKDVEVWKEYTDTDGDKQSIRVTQFFPASDTRMRWRHIQVNTLAEGNRFRFHLPQKKNTADGEASVRITFAGARSGKRMEVKQSFALER